MFWIIIHLKDKNVDLYSDLQWEYDQQDSEG